VEHILLVKDHASLRHTLALVLDGESGFEVVAQADTVAGAYDALGGLRVVSVRAYQEIQPR
jgi:DNA-binding NarL/FixJ family response regulator